MKTELTIAQAKAFGEKVRPMLGFLFRARRRLEQLGFDRNCKLYTDVDRAYGAVHSLNVELHYQSIAHGVGRLPKEE